MNAEIPTIDRTPDCAGHELPDLSGPNATAARTNAALLRSHPVSMPAIANCGSQAAVLANGPELR
jgi:hypothetical protein